jgi:hypothetical protein
MLVEQDRRLHFMPTTSMPIRIRSMPQHALRCVGLIASLAFAGCDRSETGASGSASDAIATPKRDAMPLTPKANNASGNIDGEAAAPEPPLDAQYGRLLTVIVNEDGLIEYARLAADANCAELDAVISGLAAAALPSEADKNARLALWLNAFNANALKMTLGESRKDGFTTVNEVPGFFDLMSITVAGEPTTLAALRDKMRGMNDPRVHAAMVFGAMTAPALRIEAYAADRLDSQLDEQAERWLDNRGQNRTTRRELLLSPLFETYAADFEVEPYKGVVGFVRKHAHPGGSLRDFMRSIGEVKVVYMPYNWSINKAREIAPLPTP